MKKSKPANHTLRKHGLLGMALIVALISLALFSFVYIYTPRIDRLLYNERLSQMEEVTTQLFSGLEDVVQLRWDNADTQLRYLIDENPQTMDELHSFLLHQAELNGMEASSTELVAVTTDGSFYTQEGAKGLISDQQALLENPARISYVFNSMFSDAANMVFLIRLPQPLTVADGNRSVTFTYFGVSQDMTALLPYFGCSAYDNSNSMYVVDQNGLKIFSNSATDNLRGSNIYNILSNMDYLHGSSFDQAKEELDRNGVAYSNAVLDGQEYYYALYRMNSAEWTLLFAVPSSYVAVNTVQLILTTTHMIVGFAILVLLCSGILIFCIMRKQQKIAVEQERQNTLHLEQVNAELAQAVEAARSASEQAQRSMEEANRANHAKSDFLSNMSHDIRTPMNAIVGITNLMEHDRDDPEKIELYIHKVQSSSQHLLSLINDILDMSRIEANQVTLNQEPVNLAEQIGQVDSIMWPQIDARSQTFLIRAHEIVHENLISDAVRLRQIFINLLSNASKYTPVGGSVQLDLTELPSEDPNRALIEIIVTDSGDGMSPEFLTHIFDPFTRAQSSTVNKVQGTGLGLSIIKRIIDMMGGTIQVESELGKGSRFRVLLPLPIDTSVSPTLNSRGVLLISDEAQLTRNATIAFQATDVPLLVAADMDEAGRILLEGQVDTILLSGHIHDPALHDIIETLRTEARNATVLFCVDYARQDQASAALRIGGIDGLITRPFFLSTLAHVLNQMRTELPAEDSEDASENVLTGLNFLCAEDNGLNAEILQAILDMNGAKCSICSDGAQLLEAFNRMKPGEYDAILMDVQMPVMNGLDATRAIRASRNPLGRTIPIIAMTANAFSSDVQACLDAGMNAHLAKPLDIPALQRAVRTYVSSVRSQPNS